MGDHHGLPLTRGASLQLTGRADFWHPTGYNTRCPEQLLALLIDHLQPRLPAAQGGRVALVEALIHHQDIRHPLGQPRTIPPERLLPAQRTALIAPDIGGTWRIRGVRLVATDLGFPPGRGRRCGVAAEALLMTVACRPGVVGELTGPGQRKLAREAGTIALPPP